jgi:hypothetical protein
VSGQSKETRDALDAAAAVVENGQETYSNFGLDRSHLTPRKHGNLMGLAYATAIRALIEPECQPAQPVVPSEPAAVYFIRRKNSPDSIWMETNNFDPRKCLLSEELALLDVRVLYTAAPGLTTLRAAGFESVDELVSACAIAQIAANRLHNIAEDYVRHLHKRGAADERDQVIKNIDAALAAAPSPEAKP